MRVVVFVFLNFECPVLLLELYTDINVYIRILFVVRVILDIAVAELSKSVDKFPLAIYER